MSKLAWGNIGDRQFELGVDQGVLYLPNGGVYDTAVAWNGLTTVTESPSGAAATPSYADNSKYMNLVAAEDFGGTIEAFTFPTEFYQCDGSAVVNGGVVLGQQNRRTFGLSYRTKIGNDTIGQDAGFKIHLVYGALAAPSERAYATVNDSPAAISFSWTFSCTPVNVAGGYKPVSVLTVDSTKVPTSYMNNLLDIIYGTSSVNARLPLPDEVVALFAGDQTAVTPTAPTFNAATGVITIPTVAGVVYRRTDTNAVVSGTVTIPVSGQSLVIKAYPASGAYKFNANVDDDFSFTRS